MKLSRHLISCLISFCFCAFVLPLNERIAFAVPSDKHTLLLSYGLKFGFGIFLYFVVLFVAKFVSQLRSHNPLYETWLKCSMTYGAVTLILFVLLYPGNFLWDEFYVLHAVKEYSLSSWQNYFSNIYYTFCLYLFPTAVSIVVFQMLFSSFVVGYVVSHVMQLFKNKNLAYWLFLPFLFIPVLYYDLYPMRLTVYSYVEILLLSKLTLIYFKIQNSNKYGSLLYMSLLLALLCFWRSEGIYYLLLLPYIVYQLDIFSKDQLKRAMPYAWTALCLFVLAAALMVTKLTSNPEYQLPSTINPLSTMLQHPLKGGQLQSKLSAIDRVVKVSALRDNPSYTDIPALSDGTSLRLDYKQHIQEYNQAAIYIFIHNPSPYLDNRLHTFLAANTFDKPIPQVGEGGLRFFSAQPERKAVVQDFVTTNHLSKPILPAVKRLATRLLLGVDKNDHNTIFSHLIWNVIPTVLLLLLVGIKKMHSKSYIWALLIALVVLRFLLVFITAPADYFMYYLPVYMSGNLILCLSLLLYLDMNMKVVSRFISRAERIFAPLRPLR